MDGARSHSGAGAGTAGAQREQRALRIGIVLSGTLVEERLIRERETVSVGQSIQNTFSAPISGLPLRWPLFVVEGGQYTLHISERMDGRISAGGEVHTFAQLKSEGIAQKRGDHFVIPLSDTSRGKVTVGDLSLLFQFVTPPPLQPRPHLPASVRGTLTDRFDTRLATILGVSIALHMSVAAVGLFRERADQTRIQRLADEQYEARVVEPEFDLPEEPDETPDVDEAPEVEDDPGDEVAEAPPEPEHSPAEPDDEGGEEDPGLDEAQLREEIADTAFLAVATGRSAEDGPYRAMQETDQGVSLDEAIDDVRERGSGVAAGGSPGDSGTRGPDRGDIGTGDGPDVDGPGNGNGLDRTPEEEQIASRADFTGGSEAYDDTTLDPRDVAQRIRSRYLRGIQRCHERALRQDPTAGGRVELDFTVGPAGRVVRADVFGFNSVVDDCIEDLTSGWRFGIPHDSGGDPTSADFLIPLVLEPGG